MIENLECRTPQEVYDIMTTHYGQVIKESETMISIIKKVDIKNISFTNEECAIIDMIKGEQGWDG